MLSVTLCACETFDTDKLVSYLVSNGILSTNRLYHAIQNEIYHAGPGYKNNNHKTMKQYTKPRKS